MPSEIVSKDMLVTTLFIGQVFRGRVLRSTLMLEMGNPPSVSTAPTFGCKGSPLAWKLIFSCTPLPENNLQLPWSLFLGEKNPQLPWGFFFLIWLWHGCTFMPSAVPNIHSQLNPHPAAFCDKLFAFLGRFGEIVFQIQFITSCNMAV